MIELTEELIQKHRKVVEAAVKAHTRHSKTGKTFTVKAFDRKLQFSKGIYGQHVADSKHGRFVIGKNTAGKHWLDRNGMRVGEFSSKAEAMKHAEKRHAELSGVKPGTEKKATAKLLRKQNRRVRKENSKRSGRAPGYAD